MMNIALPNQIDEWVEIQVKNDCNNISDYTADLVCCNERDREKMKTFQKAINKGIGSGVSDRSMLDVLKQARKTAKK
ncbi:MAG: type II toxin-antitoxin system ParD family antitoxin [Methylococcales bacterium]|jgi:Arc/MetJ-type ribon-helix-helix transcriptional regulator|nr:type II toxin-antitoxin system ParD family antitoxin [Methylococcales bacterium]